MSDLSDVEAIATVVCKHVPPKRICDKGLTCPCWEEHAVPAAKEIVARYQRWLSDNGVVIVPVQPTEAMIEAAAPSMARVNNIVSMAAMRGFTLVWDDGKPPLWHAYKAILSASDKGKAP